MHIIHVLDTVYNLINVCRFICCFLQDFIKVHFIMRSRHVSQKIFSHDIITWRAWGWIRVSWLSILICTNGNAKEVIWSSPGVPVSYIQQKRLHWRHLCGLVTYSTEKSFCCEKTDDKNQLGIVFTKWTNFCASPMNVSWDGFENSLQFCLLPYLRWL